MAIVSAIKTRVVKEPCWLHFGDLRWHVKRANRNVGCTKDWELALMRADELANPGRNYMPNELRAHG